MANKVDAKVVLLGKEYSGKTCLVERYLHDRFNKDIPYQNVSKCIIIQIWLGSDQKWQWNAGIWVYHEVLQNIYNITDRIWSQNPKHSLQQ
jgi:GTPase SAR1 family protein